LPKDLESLFRRSASGKQSGYDVSAFDISEAGLDKTKRLAEKARVHVRAFRANIWDYRLEEDYDVLYSSGVLHYIKPELRDEVMANYIDVLSRM